MLLESRKHRLADERYEGQKTLAITACLLRPRDGFSNPLVVRTCVETLTSHANRSRCLVPIYCFMPHHVHLLIQGRDEASQPKEVIDGFKLTTSLRFARNCPAIRWQRSYYDHIIRKSEDWRGQAPYIYSNPVRAGLVAEPSEYPFTGSMGYELPEILEGLSWMFTV